jgi:iron complex outermembrane receptor protein
MLVLTGTLAMNAPAFAADGPDQDKVAAQADDAPDPQTASAGRPDDIVITAERRRVDVQKTTIAATVFNGEDLKKKGIDTVDALQFATPGLTLQDTGQNVLISIRGVGKSEGGIQDPSGVLIYRDGVSASPGGFLAGEPYYDLAGIEVLRGPQGTLAGANAVGGAIFIRSADPTLDRVSGFGEAQYGNYNEARFQGALNVPLGDTFAIRAATNLERRDTFYDIKGPWTGDPGNHREADGRLSLLWQPSDNFKAVWKNDYVYIDHGASPAGPKGRPLSQLFDLTSDANLKAIEQGFRSVLQLNYTFDGGVSLRSISGYQWGRTQFDLDNDGTWAGAPGGLAPLIYTVNGRERTLSQEVDLVSPDKGPLTWLLGAVFQDDNVLIPHNGFVQSAGPGGTATTGVATQIGYQTSRQSWGFFGQASYDITNNLQLQLGARYSTSRLRLDDELQLTVNGAPLIVQTINGQRQSDQRLTGKAALNYKLGKDGFLYAFVATGQKSGGINPLAAVGSVPGTLAPVFDPETVTDYEIGWKQTMLGGHLRTQIDAYRYDYKHFQLTIFDPASSLGQVKNASGTTTIKGVEAQAQLKFGGFAVDGGVAYSDSALGKFLAIDSRNAAAGPQVLDGRTLPNAPAWTFNVGTEYAADLGNGDTLTPRVDVGHVGNRWGSVFQLPSIDKLNAQTLVNAQLIYGRHDGWQVTLYATNLFNLHYVSSLSMANLASAGAPRQFGLRIRKSF